MPGPSFVAIDVETANARYHSICQIGLVRFEDGREVESRAVYVDPRDDFAPFNVQLHGIGPGKVQGAPCFRDLAPDLSAWISGQTVVSHSHFDRSAVRLASERWQIAPPAPALWIDSVHVAMAAFPELVQRGCSLRDLADALGIRFRHHDALEDARAAALLVAKATEATGKTPQELAAQTVAVRIEARRKSPWAGKNVSRVGDGDGGLLGETIVFTGELKIPRAEAADMAAEAGGDVGSSVTMRTTMLVVGDREILPGWQAKSTKHRRAEELIARGAPIRIVGEKDFLSLAAIKD